MENRIEIDDGSKVYNLYNKQNKFLGQFTFIPSDIDIAKRYEHTVKEFQRMQKEIEEKENTDMEYMNELDKEMCKQVDYLFNAPVSESFFSITSPFTPTDEGHFFVENVIDSIRKVVEKERGIKMKAIEKHVNEYTSKYKVGPGGYFSVNK